MGMSLFGADALQRPSGLSLCSIWSSGGFVKCVRSVERRAQRLGPGFPQNVHSCARTQRRLPASSLSMTCFLVLIHRPSPLANRSHEKQQLPGGGTLGFLFCVVL